MSEKKNELEGFKKELNELGFKKGSKVPEAVQMRLRELRKKGMSAPILSKETGISVSTIYKIVSSQNKIPKIKRLRIKKEIIPVYNNQLIRVILKSGHIIELNQNQLTKSLFNLINE